MDDPLRVLQVGDDPAPGEVVAGRLERESDGAVEAVTDPDAAAALDRIERAGGDGERIDCVVTGYDLPDADGVSLLRSVREARPALPVVLFTAAGSEAVAADAVAAGVTDYVPADGRSPAGPAGDGRESPPDAGAGPDAGSGTDGGEDGESPAVADGAYDRLVDAVLDAGRRDRARGTGDRGRERPTEPGGNGGEAAGDGGAAGDEEAAGDGDAADDGHPTGNGAGTGAAPVPGEGVLRAVDEATDEGLLVVDGDGRVRYHDDRVTDLLGLGESGLDGGAERSLVESVGDRVVDGSAWWSVVKAVTDDPGTVHRAELRLADGRRVECRAVPVDDGGDRGRVWAFREVTDRRRTELELERRDELLEAVAGSGPIVLFAVDADGTFTLSTGEGLDSLGLEPGELVGESVFDVYDDAPPVVENVRRALGGDRFRDRVEVDGRTFETWYRPVVVDGDVDGAVGAAVDVTDRVAYERTLATLHGVAADLAAVETVEAVGRLTAAAAEEVLDLDAVVVGVADGGRLRPVATSTEGGTDDVPTPGVEGGLADHTHRTGESSLVGDLRTADVADDPGGFRSAVSVPVGDHGVLQALARDPDAFDAGDRELAELLAAHAAEALSRIERERRLRERNERLEEFASLVSHDLRGPLEVARGRVELAREAADPDAAVAEHLDEAAVAAERMWTLVEDLLALAREGRAATDPEPVDPAAVAEAARDRVDVEDVDLVVETEADRPVVADADHLERAVENLLRNAAEHGAPAAGGDGSGSEAGTVSADGGEGDAATAGSDGGDGDPGSGRPTVTVTVGDLDAGGEEGGDGHDPEGFFVADDGAGIPPERRSEVFEPGYTTGESGTGYGLRIVQRVAEAHGWQVRLVESGAGGARFEFRGVDRPRD